MATSSATELGMQKKWEGCVVTDREMLELAAKAAGIDIEMTPAGMPWLASGKRPWNPLADDGDALRLAVALNLSADFFYDEICVGYTPNSNTCDQLEEPVNDNPYAATRRAITRAAAMIGRAMG